MINIKPLNSQFLILNYAALSGRNLTTTNPQPIALLWAELNCAFSAHYQHVNWLLSAIEASIQIG